MTSIRGESFMICVGLQPLLATREGERENEIEIEGEREEESEPQLGGTTGLGISQVQG